MGCINTISYDRFPKQTDNKGKRVKVIYHYDTSRCHYGTILRDDAEQPFRTIVQLDNGNTLLGSECQFSTIN